MYRVVWLRTALDELGAAWIQADAELRASITAGTYRIDQLLQSNPQQQGESRSHGQRILFQLPLGLTFEVHEQDGIVRVLHVWIIRKGPKP
jgi:hypothetical protein